jgi:pimeloyl-ACP methyl ester carboxylesterase/DNA-binding winged helix-turn-helix (wHTH) protein
LYYRFNDYSVDTDRRELVRDSQLVPIEPQVFDLLVYLIQNRDKVVTKDVLLETVWQGRVVSESTFNTRINAVRRAIGDSGAEQSLIRTVSRKGYRFVGTLGENGHAVPRASVNPSAPELRQEIRFCTASDGVRIAYATVGQGSPVVKAGNWLNHLEYDWKSPVWSHLLRAVASKHRLIRYDARGNGLSDWNVDDISIEPFVRDLETVIDANNLDRFALLGISQGCAVSIAYAVRNPDRVSHLVLYGGYVRGRRKRGIPGGVEQSEALITLMRQGWGTDNPAFRQLFTSLFIPGGTTEQMDWFNDLQRLTTSPENAARFRRALDDIDVSHLLAKVRTPTLVIHCRDDAVVPFEEGRHLASGIDGARFVALEGRNHLILQDEPAWPRFLGELEAFLAT